MVLNRVLILLEVHLVDRMWCSSDGHADHLQFVRFN